MNCATCHDLLAERFCGQLEADADQQLTAHLADCADCRAEHDSLVATLALFNQAGPLTSPVTNDPWPELQRNLAQQRRQRLRRWALPLAALAAALVLALLVLPSGDPGARSSGQQQLAAQKPNAPAPLVAVAEKGSEVASTPDTPLAPSESVPKLEPQKPSKPTRLAVQPTPSAPITDQPPPLETQANQDRQRVATYWRRARPLLMAMANRELEAEPLSPKVLAKERHLAASLARDAAQLQSELGQRLAPEHLRMVEDSHRLFRQLAESDPTHYLAQATAVQDHVVDQSLLFRIALFQLRNNATSRG